MISDLEQKKFIAWLNTFEVYDFSDRWTRTDDVLFYSLLALFAAAIIGALV